jgi:hypothetical protein
MDTPIYPPATAYEAPVLQPYVLSVDGCAVAELKSDPAAWAIVLKHMPAIKFLVDVPETQKLLDNMTIVDFSVFSAPIDPKLLASMNAELARLPGSKRGL